MVIVKKNLFFVRLLTILCLATFVTTAVSSRTPGYAAEASDNQVWVDVRSKQDYQNGHIDDAVNIPHGDIGHKVLSLVPDLFKEIHIYDGDSGTFAGLALEMLMELGYQDVINEGGYQELLEKNKE